jgi:sulfate transport system substrate-binding protein
VLLSWENEAFLAERELGKGQFETVLPSLSILAEPSVAVVNKVVEKNGNAKIAKAYLEYLYSNKAQNLVAEHFYRPANPKIAKKYEDKFPKLELLTIKDFGGWTKAQKEHFDDNGTFDQIMKR